MLASPSTDPMSVPAMKQLIIRLKNQPTQIINVWDHETAEGWLKDLESYFRIAGYIYAKADIVSVTESDFGEESRRGGAATK